MKVCPRCNTQNPDANAFCMNCGGELAPRPQQPQQQQQKNNLLPILITIIIVVAIIVAGVVAIVIVKNNNEPQTTQPISTFAPTTTTTTETTTKETTTKKAKKTTTQPPVINNYNYYYHDYEDYYYAEDGYLYPSDTTYIDYDYLASVGQDETRLILNEMYARHGYIFKEHPYIEYFNAKSWYVPVYRDMQDAQNQFNNIEKSNLNTIVAYEKSRGWR